MANEDSKVSLRLLIDARSHKVLFAEAGKNFVDFIFNFLTLPLGSVIKLLSPQAMVGSIGKLYQSVENLNETCLVPNRDKSILLQPKASIFDVAGPSLMGTKRNINFPSASTSSAFVFSSSPIFSNAFSVSSSSCGSISSAVSVGTGGENVRGFVKDVITYMITDDLEVTPISAISSITLLNRFNTKDVQLKEKVVVVGMKEGLALLKASLESSTVLTDVFCSSTRKSEAPSHSTKVDAWSL